MPEEFAFEKVIRNGAAVDRDEFVVDAGDRLRNQFLADTRFTLDKYGTRMYDCPLDNLAETLHSRAFPD